MTKDEEIAQLKQSLELSRKSYYALADTIAAGSVSFEHLLCIARMTREQRDEAVSALESGLTKHALDFACRCGKCEPYVYDRSRCSYTRLPIAQSQ